MTIEQLWDEIRHLPDWIHFILTILFICLICALVISCTADNPSLVNPSHDMLDDLSMQSEMGTTIDMSSDMVPASCMISGKNTCSLNDMSIICRMANGVLGLCDCQLATGCCCL